MIIVRSTMYSHYLSTYFYNLDSDLYQCKKNDAVHVVANIALDIMINMSRCTEGLLEITKDYGNRKLLNNIHNDIVQHLSTCQMFNLDGYICFCSKEYMDRINSFLVYVCRRISIQEKQDSIIAELRKYVSCGKPHKELIYLDHTGSRIEMFDTNYNRLMPEAARLYAIEYGTKDDDVLATDIALNYLLRTLPKMILIRMRQENPFIQTLKRVFDDRVLLLTKG